MLAYINKFKFTIIASLEIVASTVTSQPSLFASVLVFIKCASEKLCFSRFTANEYENGMAVIDLPSILLFEVINPFMTCFLLMKCEESL